MKDEKTSLHASAPASGYEVGYGKPPRVTRFQPGRSGNPKGRPRGAKNKRPALNEERLKEIIVDEAYREITVRDGDRNVSVPMAQAVVRATAVKAAKGDHRSQRLFAEMLTATERENKALSDNWFETAITYKVEWESELERREELGITGPEPLPHPDHVKIDMQTGRAWIAGPSTKEEKAELDGWCQRRAEFEAELEDLNAAFDAADDVQTRQLILGDIRQTAKILTMLEKVRA